MTELTFDIGARAEPRSLAFRIALLAILGTALPVKGIFLILPFAAIALILWEGEDCSRLFFWLGVLIVVSALSMLVDLSRGRDISISGLLFALLGYMPVLLLCCTNVRLALRPGEADRLVGWLSWFVIGESLIAFGQIAMTGNPDTVGGTFALLSDPTIVQVYFTFTLIMTLFVLHRHLHRVLALSAMFFGLAAVAVAQSGHQTVFTLAAIGVVSLSSPWAMRKGKFGLLLAGVLLTLLTLIFYPATYVIGQMWIDKTVWNANSPKRLLVSSICTVLSDPKNFFLGTGLGQFSSRGALIASGHYLASASVPRFLVSRSSYFVAQIQPLLYLFDRIGEGSAISKPYFSAASWLAETGVVLFGAVTLAILREFRMALHCIRDGDEAVVGAARTMMLMLVLFVLCTFIENYAEFSWCDFLPATLYLITRSELTMREPTAHARLSLPGRSSPP